ncbi:Alcohol oxidase OS=Candida boidinii GN=AOD1 PE=1 SV=1 [Rhizoctonia solani AG-1 IB]|uniref:Alcohol oxidase n=1 Tax=Thanatephorus cucumeris (strain AG1-IB / isolate 7/3/14) TaxID=1108050 RepID=A0A0B7F5F0_THACB|nr:Alcohol oxidase OS=Candida boidinii GN=AOD1 PE=1 SV=1 [Rhizoctonia solani AG-1 IB]
MSQIQSEVDIIFVGGGTAACVAAGRLAKSNPELSILLVEQGSNNYQEPSVVTPAVFLSHLAPTSKTAVFWQGNKSDALNGRSPIVPSGRMLGGGSSVNFLMYTRPSASDFDDWKTEGWGSKDLLPLLRKMESYHVAPTCESHGYDGPLNVSFGDKEHFPAIAQSYLEVAQKRGVPLAQDKQDLKTGHGCQRWAKWVDPATGYRQDAAHRYIHPLSDNEHLHILTATKVVRVVFDGNKATGVEVVGDKDTEEGADQTPRVIKARKLVVVSAGALGSPVVLQRSGVGEAERLTKLGIDVVSDLPIGSTYEDHHLVLTPYHVPDDADTIDPIMSQDPAFLQQAQAHFAQGKGALTTNWIDSGSKLRPTPKELEEIGPAFAPVWKKYFEPNPDKPVMLQAVVAGWLGPRELLPHKDNRMIMMGNFTAYPISRGHVYITSKDPYAAPDFETGFFKEQADVDVHIWAYKHAREIARRLPQYRGEFAALHPKFPEGSAAGCVKLEGPPDVDNVKDIVYTAEDNKAIESYVRQLVETTWHSVGTILMKAKEQGGSVDTRLNVYGTQNLKVADLSIIPGNVGSNTNSTALVIGEKAAVIIAEDLGLKLN